VLCHDLQPEPVARLAQDGVQPCASAAELVAASDVVLVSLPSGQALQGLAQAALLPQARKDLLIIDLGTSGVELTRQLAARFAEKGARYLDAPVARTRQAAENGTLSIMVGGSQADFDAALPLLQCLASDITHCGPTGSGQVTKILNNMVLFQTVLALSEAYAIARRAGFDADLVFDTLTKGSGDSFALRNHGKKAILTGEFPTRAFSVEYARKDLSYALAMGRELGIEMRGATAVDQSFDQAIAAGLGDRYFPVISQLIEGAAEAARS
jgi:3-hydroxyisobutyrate dehydrogenase-like beta-hydroxyacid dehydrogenase